MIKKYEQMDTSGFDMQGNGTWIRLGKGLSTAHYEFVINTGRIHHDFKSKKKDATNLTIQAENYAKRVNNEREFIDNYKKRLKSLLLDWNWATDIEAGIISIADDGKIELDHYLLDDTVLPVDNKFLVDNFGVFRVFLGNYPKDYDTYTASYNGNKTIILNEVLRREYDPKVDKFVLGYPSPKNDLTPELLEHNEIVWVGTYLLNFYSGKIKALQDSLEKKTKAD